MLRCGDFTYEIIRKRVKHICIRVTTDQKVTVTAPMRAGQKQIEEFVISKQGWIEEKLDQMKEKVVLHVNEMQWNRQKEEYLCGIMSGIFPRFAAYNISYPTLKFRKMVSRYGSCQPKTGNITLNKILADMPVECAEYVAAHELAHLIEANHGNGFYRVLSEVMPDYKQRERKLQEYVLVKKETLDLP